MTQTAHLGLLRTLHDGERVVSSAALHDHLGGRRYQEFIEFNAQKSEKKNSAYRFRQPAMGFDPAAVEAFLATSPHP